MLKIALVLMAIYWCCFSGKSQSGSEDYDSEESETAQEKKIRLTKQYLAQLKEEGTWYT